MQLGLGWSPHLEERHIEQLAQMCRSGTIPDGPIPFDMDTSTIAPPRNQGSQGSCSGHSRAKIGGFCNFLDTGKYIDLSPRFAYRTNQIVDGDNSGDNGASISGSALASRKFGECLEATCPYLNRYTTDIPQEAYDQALQHRILSVQQVRSTDEAVRLMGLGQGGIVFGCMWDSTLANNTDGVITRQGGQQLGGHALAAFGYVDRDGEKWVIIHNSHGAGWGKNGSAIVHPKLFDRWCRELHGAWLLSDLQEYQVREFADLTGVGQTRGKWERMMKGGVA